MKVIRVCCKIVQAILVGLLLTWVVCAPLAWILRDGLGPGSVETGWLAGLLKLAVPWGTPAVVLAVALVGLGYLGNRLGW